METQQQNDYKKQIEEIINELKKIIEIDISNLKYYLGFARRQKDGEVAISFLESFLKEISNLHNKIINIKNKNVDLFIENETLNNLSKDIESYIYAISNMILRDINFAKMNQQSKLCIDIPTLEKYIDTLAKSINNLIVYLNNLLLFPSTTKEKVIKTTDGSFDKTKEIIKRELRETKTKFSEGAKSIKEKTKEELKNKLPSILTILHVIVIITTSVLTYIFGNLIISSIILLIILIFLAFLGKKSVFWIISSFMIGMIIISVIYVLFHTTFSEVICIFSPTLCPKKIERHIERDISYIREAVMKTIKKIQYIIENPELAYIESRAESVATRAAYQYLFEIININEVPLNYLFYSSNNQEIVETYPLDLFYAVRYSLPLDREVNLYFNAYCLIEPLFKKNCIVDSTLSNLGTNKLYNDKEVFFNDKENFYNNIKLSNYGLLSLKCKIPKFAIDISDCVELSWGSFYLNNHFLILLSNVSTRTIYKFLVVDEVVLTKSIIDGRDIYDYLRLRRDEYDKGYFEGFLDFPKINILRLGVLSEYPVIKFKDISNISDFIYISLANIKEVYDITEFEVEIIYNPNHLEIDLDPKFTGINTPIYSFSCQKLIGRIKCNTVFSKSSDLFGRNLYLLYYKDKVEKIFFFIPITISFSKDFLEYSEVIITTRATYGIEKVITTEIEYKAIKI